MSHHFPPKCDECGDPVDCHSDRCSVGFWKMHDDYLEAQEHIERLRAAALEAIRWHIACPEDAEDVLEGLLAAADPEDTP